MYHYNVTYNGNLECFNNLNQVHNLYERDRYWLPLATDNQQPQLFQNLAPRCRASYWTFPNPQSRRSTRRKGKPTDLNLDGRHPGTNNPIPGKFVRIIHTVYREFGFLVILCDNTTLWPPPIVSNRVRYFNWKWQFNQHLLQGSVQHRVSKIMASRAVSSTRRTFIQEHVITLIKTVSPTHDSWTINSIEVQPLVDTQSVNRSTRVLAVRPETSPEFTIRFEVCAVRRPPHSKFIKTS